MLLALRINVLAKGHSGISLNTLQQYVAAFNGKTFSNVLNFPRASTMLPPNRSSQIHTSMV